MIDPQRRILDALALCKRVLITTHSRPDGDALGTAAAMAMGLRRKQIDSEVLLFDRLPVKYAFLFNGNNIAHHDVEAGWPQPYPLEKYDALLVVDTGTWSQLPGLREHLDGWKKPRLVLDHHLTQEDWADVKLVDTAAAAAGEIAAGLLAQWKIPIDRSIATALFVAIASDTGWFQFSNTRPATLRLAADLMEAGVDTDSIYQHLYQNERAERLALQTRAQDSLELLQNGRLAVMRVLKTDFEQTGAKPQDTENLINIPLQIRTVEVSILMIEPLDDSPIRISLRSKGQVDVARFAEQFGGGGHARAAGLKMLGPLAAAHGRIVTAMAKSLP
ncbi:MAG TPA: DHH family phosphoesterase [Tepidisphaeraceae bacterium]|jgi:phosphoesterase RecJ-like protein|nr:DHH family phosphoesterase [Tepidisphaeraceae bacterium]